MAAILDFETLATLTFPHRTMGVFGIMR